MVWFKWIIAITLIYIVFVYLVCKFLTDIRFRYKNLKAGRPAAVKEDQVMDKANCELDCELDCEVDCEVDES